MFDSISMTSVWSSTLRMLCHCVICRCFKFTYDDIREVHKRRYLLQPMGLELFSADGRNFLLAFPKKEIRNKVLAR